MRALPTSMTLNKLFYSTTSRAKFFVFIYIYNIYIYIYIYIYICMYIYYGRYRLGSELLKQLLHQDCLADFF